MSQLDLNDLSEAERSALKDAMAMLDPYLQLARVNLETDKPE